jgi:hypothetical protein
MHGIAVVQDRVPQPDAAVAIQNVKPFRLAVQHCTAVPRSIHDVLHPTRLRACNGHIPKRLTQC